MTEPMTDTDRARLERLLEGFHPQQFALTAGEARGLFARVSALEVENAALKAELTKHAVFMDYDCPGDTPEPCGLVCQICGETVEEDGSGHAATCLLSHRALFPGGPDA